MMKRLLAAVLAICMLLAAPAFAEESGSLEDMHPILDSVLRAMEGDMVYAPGDSAYFWSVLGLLCINWEWDNPLCEISESELRVPRQAMQEFATAAFLEYSDLLPLPEGEFFVRYDEGWDSYFVMMADGGESWTEMSEPTWNEDGTATVDVSLNAYGTPDILVMRATLAANPYADAVTEPTYLYSVSAAEIIEKNPVSRTRVIEMEGTQEEIVEARYTSEFGFTIWLDAERFFASADPATEGLERFESINNPDVTLTIVPVEITAEEAESFLAEALFELEEVSEQREVEMENGLYCISAEGLSEGMAYRFYLVVSDSGAFAITASFPEEAMEGSGARLEYAVTSMRIDG